MATPGTPQNAPSATESDEHPSPGLPRREGKRWALYARSDGLAGSYTSPDTGEIVHSDEICAQLEPLRSLAETRGAEVAAEFVDYGKPGSPERDRLIAGALTSPGVALTLLFEGVGKAHPAGGHDADRALLRLLSQNMTALTQYSTERAKEIHEARRRFAR